MNPARVVGRKESNDPSPTSSTLTLSIVQLDSSVRQIDCSVTDIVTRVLDHHSCLTPNDAVESLLVRPQRQNDDAPPSTILQRNKQCHTTTLRDTVEKSILRYIRDTDRWIALTSLLLKSLAWYRSLDSANNVGVLPSLPIDDAPTPKTILSDIKEHKFLPIIDLPRTKYNRPYLPQHNSNHNIDGEVDVETGHENRGSKMNISHQYPWVCMVQLSHTTTQSNTIPSLHSSSSSSSLGIDVVTFHAPIHQITPTIFDYVSSFSHCFTPWEWDRIINCKVWSSSGFRIGSKKMSTTQRRRSDTSMLQEFYLRWSMKEAYTKAIGLGMHMNFDEFETRLSRIDDDDNNIQVDEEEGIWAAITRHMQSKDDDGKKIVRMEDNTQFSVVGRVRYTNPLPSSTWEEWEFIFITLNIAAVHEIESSSYDDKDGLLRACACICIGPSLSKKRKKTNCPKQPPITARIESLSLLEVLELHGHMLTEAEDRCGSERVLTPQPLLHLRISRHNGDL